MIQLDQNKMLLREIFIHWWKKLFKIKRFSISRNCKILHKMPKINLFRYEVQKSQTRMVSTCDNQQHYQVKPCQASKLKYLYLSCFQNFGRYN